MPIGEPGEPVVLAERSEPLGGLAWSPDGSALAFVSREPRPTAGPATAPTPAPPGADTSTTSKPPRRIDRLFPKLDGEGWIVDRPRAVFVVGTDTPAPPAAARRAPLRRRAHPPGPRTAARSPSCTVRDVPDADLTMVDALHLVDVDGDHAGELRPLTGELTTSLSHPSFSPDGTRIAVLAEEMAVVPVLRSRRRGPRRRAATRRCSTTGLDRQAAPFVGSRRADLAR